MRAIKKTIVTTVADIYKVNTDTMQVEHIDTVEYVGGKGARLVKSDIKRRFGDDCIVTTHDIEHAYTMPGELFIKYATLCDEADKSDNDINK